jgi:hypothetical protein
MAAITSEKVCPTCKRTYWRRVRWEDLNDDPAQCSDCSDVALTKRLSQRGRGDRRQIPGAGGLPLAGLDL